jgi:hypothetical protein
MLNELLKEVNALEKKCKIHEETIIIRHLLESFVLSQLTKKEESLTFKKAV